MFRAIIIIVEGETELGCTVEEAAQIEVSLVQTGITTGLNGPISFLRLGKGDEVSVTITLAEAVDFAMELDEREDRGNPRERDLSVLDQNLTQPAEIARSHGYTDLDDLLRPSTGWIMQVHTGKEALEGRYIAELSK